MLHISCENSLTWYTHLCTDWMNSYCAVQLLFCQSTLDSSCKPLGNFSSIWTKHMEPNNSLLNKREVNSNSLMHLFFSDNFEDFWHWQDYKTLK